MSAARWIVLAALTGVVLPPDLAAQRVSGRSAVFFESYRFGPGLAFDQVSELTVPLGLTLRFGSFGDLALSSGYARVGLSSASLQLPDQQISGLLDTEARLSVNLVPGKLVLLVMGAAPTGTQTVQPEELAVLGVIASDVIGFATSTLGTGGNLGGGLAGAVPVGRFAVGFAATVRQPMGYTPVLGQPDELQPGNEIRLRSGFEGPVGRRTYVRVAGIFARTAKDRVAGFPRHGVGNRVIGYASVNQGLGAASVTLYGFDVFRSDPQIEQTAIGAALLPRGNVLGAGGRVDLRLGPAMSLAPRAEYRLSAAAPDTAVSGLERLGQSLRVGFDLRRRLTPAAVLVLQGGGVRGHVVQAGTRVNLSGYRAALHLELRP